MSEFDDLKSAVDRAKSLCLYSGDCYVVYYSELEKNFRVEMAASSIKEECGLVAVAQIEVKPVTTVLLNDQQLDKIFKVT